MATIKRFVTAGTLVLMATATASAQGPAAADAELIRSRQAIATMEAILQRAVLSGAEIVVNQVRTVMPTDRPRLSGSPRVSGVRLAGYGIVFNVQVPSLDMPILWDVLVRNNQGRDPGMFLQQLRTYVMGLPPGPQRAEMQELVFQMEMRLATGNLRAGERPRDAVSAASLVPSTPTALSDKVDPRVVEDPEGAYTREIKAALIEAMLVNSQPLAIASEEWLTVVARDGVPSNPLFPGDSIDASTWVLRVKGSALAALRSQTITKEEAQKQVEVREQ